jgi:hypothetical protein
LSGGAEFKKLEQAARDSVKSITASFFDAVNEVNPSGSDLSNLIKRTAVSAAS